MDIEITQVNRQEILQYLLWRGSGIPQDIEQMLDEMIEQTLNHIRPKYVWKQFQVEQTEKGVRLPEIHTQTDSEDLREMLADCKSCVWMAATLGNEMERLIRMTQARDLTRAVVLDSCGSAAIEAVCDEAQNRIAETLGWKNLTDRVSPGYGDIPMELQLKMTTVLDTPRQIGLTLTDSLILLPRKSVTAIIGLADKPQKKRFRGCAYCNMFETCSYRKAGKYCGRT